MIWGPRGQIGLEAARQADRRWAFSREFLRELRESLRKTCSRSAGDSQGAVTLARRRASGGTNTPYTYIQQMYSVCTSQSPAAPWEHGSFTSFKYQHSFQVFDPPFCTATYLSLNQFRRVNGPVLRHKLTVYSVVDVGNKPPLDFGMRKLDKMSMLVH